MADEHEAGKAAIGRRLLANTALHLTAVGGMPEQEARAAAERAMDSPDPFQIPTFEELDGPSWSLEPSVRPPSGRDPRVLAAMRWAMVQELDAVIARCAEAITAQGGDVPEDDAEP